MKTIQKAITGLALLVMCGALSYAQEEATGNLEITHQVSIFIDQGNNVALRAQDLDNEKSNYKLKVYNAEGVVVYRTLYSRKNGVIDAFDLSELPKGNYEFVLFSENQPVYAKCVSKLSVSTTEVPDQELVVELANTESELFVNR